MNGVWGRRITGLCAAAMLAAVAAPAAISAVPPATLTGPAAAAGEAADREGGDRVVRGTIVGRANQQRVVDSAVLIPDRPVRPGQAMTLSIRLVIDPGWHVNSARPTHDYLIATRAEFSGEAAAAEEIAYPDGRMVRLEFAREKLSVYEGTTTIRATLRPSREAAAGVMEATARLTYQACSNLTCLPPETVEFRLPIRIAGEPVADAGGPAASPATGSSWRRRPPGC